MLVVLDSNAVGIAAPLGGNALQELLDAHRRRQLRLVVPELVVQEVANKWAENARELRGKHNKVADELDGYGFDIDRVTEEDLEHQAEMVEKALRQRLDEADVRVPGFPEVGHGPVVRRALERRQPFDARGKDGYRDTLLWEIVKELASSEDVVLVSHDKGAFQGEDGSLAPALAAEISGGTVELVLAPKLLAERVSAQDQQARATMDGLIHERSFRTVFEEMMEEALRSFDAAGLALDLEVDLGVPVEFASLLAPDEFGGLRLDRVVLSEPGNALVDLTCWFTASVSLGVLKPWADQLQSNADIDPGPPSFFLPRTPREEVVFLMTHRHLMSSVELAVDLDSGFISYLAVLATDLVSEEDWEPAPH